MTISNHCKTDRLKRLTFIGTYIGFGEVVAEAENGRVRECLTNTGVVMIKSNDKDDFVITAFMASLERAVSIYRQDHGEGVRLPTQLCKTIIKNAKLFDKKYPNFKMD